MLSDFYNSSNEDQHYLCMKVSYSLPDSYDGCPWNNENVIIHDIIYFYCCKNDIGHVAISLSPISDCKCTNYQLWMGVCSITEKIWQSKLKLCV